MKEQDWLEKIKERMASHTEPLPTSGWQRLEHALNTPSATNRKPTKRIFLLRRYGIAAAAAALLTAISSISIWLLPETTSETLFPAKGSMATLSTIPDKLPVPLQPMKGSSTSSNHLQALAIRKATVHPHPEQSQYNILPQETSTETESTSPSSDQQQADEQYTGIKTDATSTTQQSSPTVQTSFKSNNQTSRHGWSVSLSVHNIGSSSNIGINSSSAVLQADANPYNNTNLINLCDATHNTNGIPLTHIPQMKGGIPYSRENGRQISNIDHHHPISFGLTVRKNLPKGFSVETGLVYTLLASEVTFNGSSNILDQRLHYLGIPLRANWNFLDRKSFILYLSAGGMMEKCLYGKMESEDITIRPLQFSATAAVGMQYNINRRIGLYAEPGFAYYFDDGSSIETIRKENPANFTLQAGIRLTY